VAKLTKKQLAEVDRVGRQIDSIEDLHEMSESEIKRTVSAFSEEGVALRSKRKKIRYKLYRVRTEVLGKGASGQKNAFRKKFEEQPFFGGWRNFAITWDVAFDDPFRIVHKEHSELEEWEEIVRAKFPTIVDGRVLYPDITVREKVEAYQRSQ